MLLCRMLPRILASELNSLHTFMATTVPPPPRSLLKMSLSNLDELHHAERRHLPRRQAGGISRPRASSELAGGVAWLRASRWPACTQGVSERAADA